MKIIGLMSGTSMDGIDAALTRVTPSHRFRQEDASMTPYPDDVRRRLARLVERPTRADLEQMGELSNRIGRLFADAALELMRRNGGKVDLIASHGQTIAHFPARGRDRWSSTLQIGDLDVIAHCARVTTAGDFRWGHIAGGGQGAPLAPYFLLPLAGHSRIRRVLLNLGGIANLTILPAGGRPDEVWGFDTGPANALLDSVVQNARRGAFDDGGRFARRGKVHRPWLQRLLADPYFHHPPPKSTGRETFHLRWALAPRPSAGRLSLADRLATLTELTAVTVAYSVGRWIRPLPSVIYLSGGGARNDFLVERLAARLSPIRLANVEELGLGADTLEAMGMAVLGYHALMGTAWTRSGGPIRMGRIVPGANWESLLRRIKRRKLPRKFRGR